MKQYLVTVFWVNLHTGIVELTQKQYQSRQHCLKSLGDNKYEILKPIQFKKGETFGYDGELAKVHGKDMVPCETKSAVIKEKKKDDVKG